MKTHKTTYLQLLAVMVCGIMTAACRQLSPDADIEFALRAAGDNRGELETVLEHYAGDSLKSKAARFLIANMPGHYSYADTTLVNRYYNEIDSTLALMAESGREAIADTINSIAHRLGVSSAAKVQDIRIIKSDFLIRNIDDAFYRWKHGKWARHLTFDQFCEYLLPYKVEELQPLDNWRERFSGFCTDSLDELDYCDMFRSSSYSAAVMLNRNLGRVIRPFSWSVLECPPKRIETLIAIPFGRCDDYAWLSAALFRSAGIPVSIEIVPHWAYRSLGHKGNAVLAPTGKSILFSGLSSGPENTHHVDEKIAKMFRSTYARNKEIEALHKSERFVPDAFNSVFQKDVTDEFVATTDIRIPLDNVNTQYAYLSVYGDNDWYPVDFAKMVGKEAVFKNVGKNVMYVVMNYDRSGHMNVLTDPFVVNAEGDIVSVTPDHNALQSVTLFRKYPVIEYVHKYARLIDEGEFEAADNPDFIGASIIHTISDGAAVGHEIILPDSLPPYRYWRYIQRKRDAHTNMAEVMFYDRDNNRLTGAVIGTEGHRTIYKGMTRDKLFDGNLLTSFNSPNPNGDWAGLDFGKPVRIHKIIFYGRGDGNTVEVGDKYELFYWDANKWNSLGQTVAESVSLTYDNVPAGALLLLRDLTKGKDERIFTIGSDGRQNWW